MESIHERVHNAHLQNFFQSLETLQMRDEVSLFWPCSCGVAPTDDDGDPVCVCFFWGYASVCVQTQRFSRATGNPTRFSDFLVLVITLSLSLIRCYHHHYYALLYIFLSFSSYSSCFVLSSCSFWSSASLPFALLLWLLMVFASCKNTLHSLMEGNACSYKKDYSDSHELMLQIMLCVCVYFALFSAHCMAL